MHRLQSDYFTNYPSCFPHLLLIKGCTEGLGKPVLNTGWTPHSHSETFIDTQSVIFELLLSC